MLCRFLYAWCNQFNPQRRYIVAFEIQQSGYVLIGRYVRQLIFSWYRDNDKCWVGRRDLCLDVSVEKVTFNCHCAFDLENKAVAFHIVCDSTFLPVAVACKLIGIYKNVEHVTESRAWLCCMHNVLRSYQ